MADEHLEVIVRRLGLIGDTNCVQQLVAVLRSAPAMPSYRQDAMRSETVEALGRLGDRRAVEPLLECLKDSSEYVRWRAAQALGRIEDPRAVEPLIRALHDPVADVRAQAGSALVNFQDRRLVSPLLEVVARPAARLKLDEWRLRRDAVMALGRQKDPALLDHFLGFLRDRDLRYSALEALSECPSPSAVNAVLQEIAKEEGDYPQQYIWTIAARNEPDSFQRLLAALSDKSDRTRETVAGALGRCANQQAVSALLQTLYHDKNDAVRRAAAKSLVLLGSPGAHGAILANLAKTRPGKKNRPNLLEAVLGLPLLTYTWLNAEVIDAITLAPEEQALAPAMTKEMRDVVSRTFAPGSRLDPDFAFWAAMQKGLEARIGSEHEQALIIGALVRDPVQQLGCVMLLPKVRTVASRNAICSAAQDLDPTVRAGAVTALRTLSVGSRAGDQCVEALRSRLGDAVPQIRLLAAAALLSAVGNEAVPWVQQALSRETDPKTQEAFRKLLGTHQGTRNI